MKSTIYYAAFSEAWGLRPEVLYGRGRGQREISNNLPKLRIPDGNSEITYQ